MKIYIFGAGASLGSQDTSSLQPQLHAPLINNLFDEQYQTYASDVFVSQSRINELKRLIGDQSLEEWLTKEWARLDEPHGKEALAAGRKLFGDLALYIWWTMVQISNTYSDANGYHLFLEKIARIDDKDEVAFVNFNYDLLLDKALTNVYGYTLGGALDYYTTYNYLKPHGSVNWFVDMRDIDKRPSRTDLNGGIQILLNRVASNMFSGEPIGKKLKILDPVNRNLYDLQNFFSRIYTGGAYGYPIVMLPLSAKMYDLIDGFIDRMRAEFERIFSQATDVYVIGYRANDELFSEMSSNVPQGAKIHVVGRESAQQIQKDIIKTNGNYAAGEIHADGFRGFIDKLG